MGTVLLRQWARSAGLDSRLSQNRVEFAACKRSADRILRERAPVCSQHRGPLLEATRRERDVRRHHHITLPGSFGNPIIRHIGTLIDDHQLDSEAARYVHRHVGNERNRHTISRGNDVHLVLHRAGVGIYEDPGHPRMVSQLRAPCERPAALGRYSGGMDPLTEDQRASLRRNLETLERELDRVQESTAVGSAPVDLDEDNFTSIASIAKLVYSKVGA